MVRPRHTIRTALSPLAPSGAQTGAMPALVVSMLSALTLLHAPASATECPGGVCAVSQPAPPAVVRVVNILGPCRSYATGTIVHDDGRKAIVLSCAHLFREGTGRVEVLLPGRSPLQATPRAIDKTWDLSTLEITSLGIGPITLSTTAPNPGEHLQSCGYGPAGIYRCNRGTAIGYAQNGSTHETLCLTGTARDGDSGGPVLNTAGQLVGVLWGTDGRTVHATYCGRIRKFLAHLLPTAPHRLPGPGNEPAPPPRPQPPSLEPITPPTQPPPPPRSQPPSLEPITPPTQPAPPRQPTPKNADPLTVLSIPKNTDLLGTAAGLTATAAPYVLAALGVSVPPLGAVALGIWGLRAFVRLRRRRRTKKQTAPVQSPGPWNDDYAAQLNSVYALSGRSPTADATLGRQYDRELREMESSADDALARWAHNLRRRVAASFHRIHDQTPLPAEPTTKP